MQHDGPYLGSVCTLTDGVTSRVLTLANTALIYNEIIFIDGQQMPSSRYSKLNQAAATITFSGVNVWNTQSIDVWYDYATTSISGYTNTALIYAKTGLTSAEINLADTNIAALVITEAEAEVETLTGRKFSDANSITEYQNGRDKDAIGNAQTAIQLAHWPVESVTLFNLLDTAGAASTTFATLTAVNIAAGTFITVDYWLETANDPLTNAQVPTGRIKLINNTIPKGTNNVKITYTYGYASMPYLVQNLATCLAAMRTWAIFAGGSYNFLNSYSIPEQTVNKGDLYQRAKQNMDTLMEEANRLLDRIGRKPRTLFFASGVDR